MIALQDIVALSIEHPRYVVRTQIYIFISYFNDLETWNLCSFYVLKVYFRMQISFLGLYFV